MAEPYADWTREELIAHCRAMDAVVEQLQGQNEQLNAVIASQQRQIDRLQREVAALRKNSSNSSKPPSSDIVKPRSPRKPPRGERIWTVVSTCVQQGRSVLDVLVEAVTAWVHDQPQPVLVPQAVATRL